jgi:hypothetical protein
MVYYNLKNKEHSHEIKIVIMVIITNFQAINNTIEKMIQINNKDKVNKNQDKKSKTKMIKMMIVIFDQKINQLKNKMINYIF